jgi:hypothetical protein
VPSRRNVLRRMEMRCGNAVRMDCMRRAWTASAIGAAVSSCHERRSHPLRTGHTPSHRQLRARTRASRSNVLSQ